MKRSFEFCELVFYQNPAVYYISKSGLMMLIRPPTHILKRNTKLLIFTFVKYKSYTEILSYDKPNLLTSFLTYFQNTHYSKYQYKLFSTADIKGDLRF